MPHSDMEDLKVGVESEQTPLNPAFYQEVFLRCPLPLPRGQSGNNRQSFLSVMVSYLV